MQLQPSISAENYVQGAYNGFVTEDGQFIEEDQGFDATQPHVQFMAHNGMAHNGMAHNVAHPFVDGSQYVYAVTPDGVPVDGSMDGRRLVPMQDEQGNVFLTEVAYSVPMGPEGPPTAGHSAQSMGDVSVTVSSVPQRASVGSGQRQVSVDEEGLEAACDAAAKESPAKAYRAPSLKHMLGGLRRKSEGC